MGSVAWRAGGGTRDERWAWEIVELNSPEGAISNCRFDVPERRVEDCNLAILRNRTLMQEKWLLRVSKAQTSSN